MQEPLDSLDVDERPPPVVKGADAQHHAYLLATFLMDNSLEFTLGRSMRCGPMVSNGVQCSVHNGGRSEGHFKHEPRAVTMNL